MITRLKLRLPDANETLLNRLLIWSAALLVFAIAGFAVYYYLDQGGAAPANEATMQRQLSEYEQVVRDDPNNITNRLALADAYYGLHRYSDAIPQYEAALVINDQSTLGQLGLGRAKLAVGDRAGASESFQKLIDQSQGADIAGELVQAAYYYLGSIALDEAKPDEAIQQLTQAVGIERSDSDAWYLMGTAYVQTGKLDEAIDALTKAVLFVPNFAEAYGKLAEVYDLKGAGAEALYARGMMAYSQGKLDDAAKQLQDAVSASPTLADAYAGLGMVRESQGQREAAIAAYQQALHLKPDHFNANSGLARLTGSASGNSSGATHPDLGSGGSPQGVTP